MKKQFNLIMDTKDYFLIKNHLVLLKQRGLFEYDSFMKKFYKAFVIDAEIKLDRKNSFNDATICFELENNNDLFMAINMFCDQQIIENKREAALIAALYDLKLYMIQYIDNYMGH